MHLNVSSINHSKRKTCWFKEMAVTLKMLFISNFSGKKIRKNFFSSMHINTLETSEENISKITERTHIKI